MSTYEVPCYLCEKMIPLKFAAKAGNLPYLFQTVCPFCHNSAFFFASQIVMSDAPEALTQSAA
jgi:hypothetical protein